MPLKSIIFLILLNFFIFPITYSSAQDIDYCREVVLPNFSDEKTYYHIYDFLDPDIKLKNHLIYFSYFKDSIYQTQGSFFGHLLHGKMRTLFPNQALREEGAFYLGLKHGTWYTWHQGGRLKSSEKWKKGERHGLSMQYNNNGQLTLRTKYKKDQMQGIVSRYENGKLIAEEKYKKGKVIDVKEKKN